MKRGKEAAVISQLEWYLIKKIKALGHWVASHDEYRLLFSSLPLLFWYLDYHLRVHECQTCKRHFHSDTASAQLMARINSGRERNSLGMGWRGYKTCRSFLFTTHE